MRVIVLFPDVEAATPFLLAEPRQAVFVAGSDPAEMAAGTVRAIRAKKPHLIVLAGTAAACDDRIPPGSVVEIVASRMEGCTREYAATGPETGLPEAVSATCGGPESAGCAAANASTVRRTARRRTGGRRVLRRVRGDGDALPADPGRHAPLRRPSRSRTGPHDAANPRRNARRNARPDRRSGSIGAGGSPGSGRPGRGRKRSASRPHIARTALQPACGARTQRAEILRKITLDGRFFYLHGCLSRKICIFIVGNRDFIIRRTAVP